MLNGPLPESLLGIMGGGRSGEQTNTVSGGGHTSCRLVQFAHEITIQVDVDPVRKPSEESIQFQFRARVVNRVLGEMGIGARMPCPESGEAR